MNRGNITKGIISSIVDQYLREIPRDPHRSIRKMVDMAVQTSNGPTQRICYQMMQNMAKNESSPYYEMIYHLVAHGDPATIKQFGINLGYNAWTFGPGNLRGILSENDVCASWDVIIDRRGKERIPFSEIRGLVERGRQMDVYAWLLICSDLDEWEEYAELFRAYPDSVFALQLNPSSLTEIVLDEAGDIHNLMFGLNTDEADWQAAASDFMERGFPYTVWREVSTVEQAEEIMSGSWLEELAPYYPLMAYTIAADELPSETALALKQYMWDTRLGQLYPVLPVDLISDFVIINHMITRRSILYRVNPDGSVSTAAKLQFETGDLKIGDLFVKQGD